MTDIPMQAKMVGNYYSILSASFQMAARCVFKKKKLCLDVARGHLCWPISQYTKPEWWYGIH